MQLFMLPAKEEINIFCNTKMILVVGDFQAWLPKTIGTTETEGRQEGGREIEQ